MADEAVFNIIIGIQNRERIKQLEKDIADAEKEIVNLSNAINQAGHSTQQQAINLRMYAKDIEAYRNEISALSKENARMGEVSDSTGINLRTLSREMFRLEEGGAEFLKVIPMLVDQLGGGAGLAAGFGLVSAAIEVTAKHWDDLMAQFTGRTGLEAAKTTMEQLAEFFKNTEVLGPLFARGAQVEENKAMIARVEEKNKRQQTEGKSISQLLSPEQKERGQIFRKAVEEYGGERLLNETMERERRGRPLTPGQMEEMRRRVQQQMGQASEGRLPEGVRGALFGPEFAEEERKQEVEITQKARVKEAKELLEHEKKIKDTAKKQLNERVDMLNKEGEANEKRFFRGEEEELQDKIAMLERQKRDVAEYAREHPEPKYGITHGGREIAESIQTDLLHQIPKQQLEVQKEMQRGIDKVRDELMALRRQGVEARAGG